MTLKDYIDYYKNNPERYWFKRKIYGWGWVPVKWQGWLTIATGLAFFFSGISIAQSDDAPGAIVIGFLIMMAIIFGFGYLKGEKPRWQWGLKDKKSPRN